jgi:lipopolysaccharide export system protein LptA
MFMKACFAFICALSVPALAHAQALGTPADYLANSIRRIDASTIELRGDVELRAGGFVIRADAVDSQLRSNGTAELAVRGHVVAIATPQLANAAASMKANVIRPSATSRLEFRGDAEIAVGGVVIRADEIDSQIQPDMTVEYELRGNVRIVVANAQ